MKDFVITYLTTNNQTQQQEVKNVMNESAAINYVSRLNDFSSIIQAIEI